VTRIKGLIGKTIALAVILAGISVWYIDSYIHGPLDVPGGGYVLEVAPGASSTRIIYDLAADGLVKWPGLLVSWLKWSGGDRKIKAGEYQLMPGITLDELLQKFYRGDVILHEVTLVEGWTLKQVLAHLCAETKIRCTLKAEDPRLASIIQNPSGQQNLEGLLFPDTYRFTRGTLDAAKRVSGVDTCFNHRKGNLDCAGARADRRCFHSTLAAQHALADRSDGHLRSWQ
jgi:UPF0755 protein